MSGDLILITGVTGYIGFQTLVLALEAGYRLRAVVRKSEQIDKLRAHVQIQPFDKNLEFVVIPHLGEKGAFDQVLGGVIGIIHLASPLAIETDDYERDIVQPAIDATISVLESASKNPSIKRVVLTSSAVTLVPIEWLSSSDTETVFNEQYINSNPKRPFNSAMEAYWASKALTRMTSKQFMIEEKPTFDLINLLPSVVIGRDALAQSVAELASGTRALALGQVLGKTLDPLVGQHVDVEDVAKAHVDALKESIPGNSDYILTSGTPSGIEWDSVKEVVSTRFPEDLATGRLSLAGSIPTRPFKIDASTTEKAFGWKFRSYEKTMQALIGQYLELLAKSEASV